jgi:hypothetical protein
MARRAVTDSRQLDLFAALQTAPALPCLPSSESAPTPAPVSTTVSPQSPPPPPPPPRPASPPPAIALTEAGTLPFWQTGLPKPLADLTPAEHHEAIFRSAQQAIAAGTLVPLAHYERPRWLVDPTGLQLIAGRLHTPETAPDGTPVTEALDPHAIDILAVALHLPGHHAYLRAHAPEIVQTPLEPSPAQIDFALRVHLNDPRPNPYARLDAPAATALLAALDPAARPAATLAIATQRPDLTPALATPTATPPTPPAVSTGQDPISPSPLTPTSSEADQRPPPLATPPSSSTPSPAADRYTLSDFARFARSLDTGNVTVADFTAEFARFTASVPGLRNALSARTMADLAPSGRGAFQKSDIVDRIIGQMFARFVLDPEAAWSPEAQTREDAARTHVAATTATDMAIFAMRRAAGEPLTAFRAITPDTPIWAASSRAAMRIQPATAGGAATTSHSTVEIDPATPPDTLQVLRQAAATMGGTLTVSRATGSGTAATFPTHAAADRFVALHGVDPAPDFRPHLAETLATDPKAAAKATLAQHLDALLTAIPGRPPAEAIATATVAPPAIAAADLRNALSRLPPSVAGFSKAIISANTLVKQAAADGMIDVSGLKAFSTIQAIVAASERSAIPAWADHPLSRFVAQQSAFSALDITSTATLQHALTALNEARQAEVHQEPQEAQPPQPAPPTQGATSTPVPTIPAPPPPGAAPPTAPAMDPDRPWRRLDPPRALVPTCVARDVSFVPFARATGTSPARFEPPLTGSEYALPGLEAYRFIIVPPREDAVTDRDACFSTYEMTTGTSVCRDTDPRTSTSATTHARNAMARLGPKATQLDALISLVLQERAAAQAAASPTELAFFTAIEPPSHPSEASQAEALPPASEPPLSPPSSPSPPSLLSPSPLPSSPAAPQEAAPPTLDASSKDASPPAPQLVTAGPAATPAEVVASATPTPTPPPPPTRATTRVNTIIQDVGEKIGGARKDAWADRGLAIADLATMSPGEQFEHVTKSNVWPRPDYPALVAAGTPANVAFLLKLTYDGLATRPKRDTPEGRRDFITMLALVREHAEAARTPDDFRRLRSTVSAALGIQPGIAAASDPAQQEGRRINLSVYPRRQDPLALDSADIRKAETQAKAGWPAPTPPWLRGIRIEPAADGSWSIRDSTTSHTIARGLRDRAEAEVFLRERHEENVAAKLGPAIPDRPHLDDITRIGPDTRDGRDVDSADFITDFGFRGVEFGNWVAGDERQKSVNLAYDALHDLARTLGISPQAISLNGTLGLAFGARGRGFGSAHYEPGKLAINLTKLQGAGSLAHEWGHAVDHYFGELDTANAYSGAPQSVSGWSDRADHTGRTTRYHDIQTGETVNAPRLDNLRPDIRDGWNAAMRLVYNRQLSQAEAIAAALRQVDHLSGRVESIRTRLAGYDADPSRAPTQNAVDQLRSTLTTLETSLIPAARQDLKTVSAIGHQPTRLVETDFYREANKLSGKAGADGYWARPTELLARAFEAYVFDKLTAAGHTSEYLVQGVEPDRFAADGYKGNPYPTGAEREAINAAFDHLFATMQEREGDRGLPALFGIDTTDITAFGCLLEDIPIPAGIVPGSTWTWDNLTFRCIASDAVVADQEFPEATAFRKDLRYALLSTASRIAPTAKLSVHDAIFKIEDGKIVGKAHGITLTGGQDTDPSIVLASNVDDPLASLAHEGLHYLYAMRVLTDAERQILYESVQLQPELQRYLAAYSNSPNLLEHESLAELSAAYRTCSKWANNESVPSYPADDTIRASRAPIDLAKVPPAAADLLERMFNGQISQRIHRHYQPLPQTYSGQAFPAPPTSATTQSNAQHQRPPPSSPSPAALEKAAPPPPSLPAPPHPATPRSDPPPPFPVPANPQAGAAWWVGQVRFECHGTDGTLRPLAPGDRRLLLATTATPEAANGRSAIAETLAAAHARTTPHAALSIADGIFAYDGIPNAGHIQPADGAAFARAAADGATPSFEIAIAADAASPHTAFYEEAFHHLAATDCLEPADHAALDQAPLTAWLTEHNIAATYPTDTPRTHRDEAIAHAFAAYAFAAYATGPDRRANPHSQPGRSEPVDPRNAPASYAGRNSAARPDDGAAFRFSAYARGSQWSGENPNKARGEHDGQHHRADAKPFENLTPAVRAIFDDILTGVIGRRFSPALLLLQPDASPTSPSPTIIAARHEGPELCPAIPPTVTPRPPQMPTAIGAAVQHAAPPPAPPPPTPSSSPSPPSHTATLAEALTLAALTTNPVDIAHHLREAATAAAALERQPGPALARTLAALPATAKATLAAVPEPSYADAPLSQRLAEAAHDHLTEARPRDIATASAPAPLKLHATDVISRTAAIDSLVAGLNAATTARDPVARFHAAQSLAALNLAAADRLASSEPFAAQHALCLSDMATDVATEAARTALTTPAIAALIQGTPTHTALQSALTDALSMADLTIADASMDAGYDADCGMEAA